MARWECRAGTRMGTTEVLYQQRKERGVASPSLPPLQVALLQGRPGWGALAWVLNTPQVAPGDVVVLEGDREYLLQPFGTRA